MPKYLFALNIEKIQEFIFQSNILREITGASNLVKLYTGKKFEEFLGVDFEEVNLLKGDIGQLQYIFSDKTKAEECFKEYPLIIKQCLGDVKISTTLKEFTDINFEFLFEVEQELNANRQKQENEFENLYAGAQRFDVSGKVAYVEKISEKDEKYSDRHSFVIAKASDEVLRTSTVIKNILNIDSYQNSLKEIAKVNPDRWLAVIHMDGNNVGQSIKDALILNSTDCITLIKKINSDILAAAEEAFTNTCIELFENIKMPLPIRPIIQGGDDINIVVAAPYAIDFASKYSELFKSNTTGIFNEEFDGIDLSIGIAFIGEKFPIHLGVDIAQDLCKMVKSKLKNESSNFSMIIAHKVLTNKLNSRSIYTEYYQTREFNNSKLKVLIQAILSGKIKRTSLHDLVTLNKSGSYSIAELKIKGDRINSLYPEISTVLGSDWLDPDILRSYVSIISDALYLLPCFQFKNYGQN